MIDDVLWEKHNEWRIRLRDFYIMLYRHHGKEDYWIFQDKWAVNGIFGKKNKHLTTAIVKAFTRMQEIVLVEAQEKNEVAIIKSLAKELAGDLLPLMHKEPANAS